MFPILVEQPGRRFFGQAEARGIEEPVGVERREARGREIAVAAQVEAQLDRLAELDDAPVGTDLEAEARSNGAGEAGWPARGGDLGDLELHGPPRRDRSRGRDGLSLAEEIAAVLRGPLDRDAGRIGADHAGLLGDQRPLDPHHEIRAPTDHALLGARRKTHCAGGSRHLELGVRTRRIRVDEMKSRHIEERDRDAVFEQLALKLAVESELDHDGHLLTDEDRPLRQHHRDPELVARLDRRDLEGEGLGPPQRRPLTHAEFGHAKRADARARQLVAVAEADFVDAAEMTVDDRDRGRRARGDAQETKRDACLRIELDHGRRLLLELCRHDLKLDRLTLVVGPGINLDTDFLRRARRRREGRDGEGRRREDERADEIRDRPSPPHQSFSTGADRRCCRSRRSFDCRRSASRSRTPCMSCPGSWDPDGSI